MKNNTIIKGIAFALITSIISGVSIFYSKISVAKIDPLILATSRNLFVGILFLLSVGISSSFRSVRSLSLKNLILLILVAAVGGGVPFFLFFTGLKSIGAQNANVIHKSLFLWVALLSFLVLKEKPRAEYLISYLFIIIGTFFFFPLKFKLGQGEIMVLLATLLWSLENIIAKIVLRQVDPSAVGLFRMFGGGLILLILTVINGKSNLLLHLSQAQLMTIGIGGTLLFFYVYFWYRALKLAPASLVALVLTFSVVVGNGLNGTFAGVKLLRVDLLSSIFIGIGTFLIYILTSRQKLEKLDQGTANG